MASKLADWFDEKPFDQQIIVLALVLDPLGFGAGWLLGPSLGVDPLVGAVFGVVAASVPTSLHVLREATS
ncbi:hypothetical protein [Halobacterium rubrum]|uniref:hypothetical protein n=1 Tax=Halobacterium TaxID=2239 RepID=UPI001F3D191D|nr:MULTISPECIES: hypothetical protein [Halobacterium]MDH5019805.1 hypothetical protein [Halobacterium rubrum]